jgi:Ca-activated chloride channel family protein
VNSLEEITLPIDITSAEVPSDSFRRPLNIIMLIDNSTSMGEDNRMTQVKESISHLVKNYNKNDQLSILTFNEEVNTILPPTRVTANNQIQTKLDEMTVSGKTNGEAGINKAFEIMQNIANPESLNMIVLATDGRIASSDYIEQKILKKIEEMNVKGYLLSVMGFTNSTYTGRKMQQMSDIGGGLYIDMSQHKENYNSLLLDEIYNTLLKIDR